MFLYTYKYGMSVYIFGTLCKLPFIFLLASSLASPLTIVMIIETRHLIKLHLKWFLKDVFYNIFLSLFIFDYAQCLLNYIYIYNCQFNLHNRIKSISLFNCIIRHIDHGTHRGWNSAWNK